MRSSSKPISRSLVMFCCLLSILCIIVLPLASSSKPISRSLVIFCCLLSILCIIVLPLAMFWCLFHFHRSPLTIACSCQLVPREIACIAYKHACMRCMQAHMQRHPSSFVLPRARSASYSSRTCQRHFPRPVKFCFAPARDRLHRLQLFAVNDACKHACETDRTTHVVLPRARSLPSRSRTCQRHASRPV